MVRGLAACSRSILGTMGGDRRTLVGRDITLLAEPCEKATDEAFARMPDQARRLGGNAVTGVRYDATERLDGVTEGLWDGTAVVLEPVGVASAGAG